MTCRVSFGNLNETKFNLKQKFEKSRSTKMQKQKVWSGNLKQKK